MREERALIKWAATAGFRLAMGCALVALHHPEFLHRLRCVVLAVSVFTRSLPTVNSCSCVCCREGRNSPYSFSSLPLVSL